jgi:hypothetical protein
MSYIDKIAGEIYQRSRDNARAEDWESLPNEERGLYIIYALLVLTVGKRVTREDVHNAWATWNALQRKDHPALEPYSSLNSTQQEQDERFRKAIQEVAENFSWYDDDLSG